MTDPLDALPYEIWIWCIAFSIDEQRDGPLELLAVSRRWDRALLDCPSLWNQIYVENGEDEIARISTFLYLSRGCSLHVDIMTALPDTMDSLQLIANQISRVSTISIRPSVSDTVTSSQMERWKHTASHILEVLGNDPLDVKSASCFGISLRENDEMYYCIALMQFTMVNTVNNASTQTSIASAGLPATTYLRKWEEQVTRYA
jgi:hypothetical protein